MDNKKLVDASVGAVTIGTVTVLGPAPAVLKPLVDVVAFACADVANTRMNAMIAETVAALADLGHYEQEEAEARLTVLLQNPKVADFIYDSFRRMLSARSRVAWRYIARITADYIETRDSAADTFFRRAGWLLERCEDEDIDAIRSLSKETGAVVKGHGVQAVRWIYKNDKVSLFVEGAGVPPAISDVEDRAIGGSRALDVLLLVVESRLGREVPHQQSGGSPSVVFRMKDDHLPRLIDLLR